MATKAQKVALAKNIAATALGSVAGSTIAGSTGAIVGAIVGSMAGRSFAAIPTDAESEVELERLAGMKKPPPSDKHQSV